MQEEYEVVPWCEEMALCDTLISYLERILRQAGLPVPGQADAAPAEGTSSSPGPSPASEKAVPEVRLPSPCLIRVQVTVASRRSSSTRTGARLS